MLGRFVDAFDFIPIIDGACEEIVLLSLRLSYKLPSRTISYMACTCTSKVFPNEIVQHEIMLVLVLFCLFVSHLRRIGLNVFFIFD